MNIQTKAVVTVAEMARMVGLSRARFYQLMGSAFPWPVYDVSTRRPIYVEEMQKVCLEVRRRNCGIDGKPILFYSRRSDLPVPSPRRPAKSKRSAKNNFADLIDGLKSLGLVATVEQVEAALNLIFPAGIDGNNPGEILRSVFLHLKRRDSSGNVGR